MLNALVKNLEVSKKGLLKATSASLDGAISYTSHFKVGPQKYYCFFIWKVREMKKYMIQQ